MHAVPVETGDRLRAGNAERLFTGYFFRNALREWDLSPDGEQFLVLKDTAMFSDGDIVPEVILVKNWTEELKRLVPVD